MGSVKNIRRVLVIGNGFDLAVGRKTSYKDFYESEYCPKNYPAPMVRYLNEKLSKDIEKVRWLDMENALQEYARLPENKKQSLDFSGFEKYVLFVCEKYRSAYSIPQFSSTSEYSSGDYCNTRNELLKMGYLTSDQFSSVIVPSFDVGELNKTFAERDALSLKKIESGLAGYLEEIGEKHEDTNSFAIYDLKHFLDNHDSVYSFNYTRIGRILTDDLKQAEVYDSMIHYMHGSLRDNHVIVGAKDGEYGDYDYVQKAFDPQFNPPPLLREMLDADEVIIYGHSLGDCDSQYFEPFFQHLVETTDDMDKKVVIYTYDEESVVQIKKNLQKLTANRLSWLYSVRQFRIVNAKKKAKSRV